jgi:very-short-patch-repair endonuclease
MTMRISEFLRNPTTVGVICDGTRYDKTDDVIEWDVFRTEILESQGWQLIRSFSPALFRDFENNLTKISELHDKIVAADLMAISAQSGSVQ